MKKAMLLLLCVMLLMSLYGCDEPTDIHFRPDNSIDPPANIYIGMPKDEFFALYPDKMTNPYREGVCFSYWGEYGFLEDTEGNPVVVQFNGWRIGSVDAYDKNTISITEETFNQLERGMSVQEMVSLTVKGFDLADKYRMTSMLLADGTLGQMMEPVSLVVGELQVYD